MAKIVAGVATSHVPAIGAAIDNGKSGEDYWKPLFKGFEPSKKWIAELNPDVIILVYNDHASAFSLEIIPTFAPNRSRRPTKAGERVRYRSFRAIPNLRGTSRSRRFSMSST